MACAALERLLARALHRSAAVWLALPLYRPAWTLPEGRDDFPLEAPEPLVKLAELHGEPMAALCRPVRELQREGRNVKPY